MFGGIRGYRDVLASKPTLGVLQGVMDEFYKLVGWDGFELEQHRTRNERAVDVEKRIVRRGTDEADRAAFYMREQDVLLALVESMDLINEENGCGVVQFAADGGLFDGCADLCDVALDA